jgi:hypothetical protein
MCHPEFNSGSGAKATLKLLKNDSLQMLKQVQHDMGGFAKLSLSMFLSGEQHN